MNKISRSRMLYCQMNDRSIGHSKASKKGFIQSNCGLEGAPDLLAHNSSRSSYLFNPVPILSTCKGSTYIGDLSVSTELPTAGDGSQCCSGGSSPPPPALSPASSSPTQLLHGLFNQTSSPSPPVIVAEIAGHSSGSSRATSEKSHSSKPVGSDGQIRPTLRNSSNIESKTALEVRNIPCLASLSSSSPTSSSSSTSSSLQTSGLHVRNGLPILEKISIAIGSPRKSIADNISIHTTKEPNDKTNTIFFPSSSVRSPAVPIALPAEPQDCQVQCHRLEQVSIGSPKVALKEELKENEERKKSVKGPRRKTNGNATRRKRQVKRRRGDSDSEFELDKSAGKFSRGKADAAAAIRRIKQRNSAKRSTLNDAQKATSTEAATNRRYLESPFLCLCQSGNTVANLSQATSIIQSRTSTMVDKSLNSSFNNVDSTIGAASIPAHIISPALRGLSGQGTNLTIGNSQSSIPPSCPLNMGTNSHGQSTVDVTENVESRAIFSGISYKPSVQQRLRDIQQSLESDSNDTNWLCAFCGEDKNFLGLGSLYGPYYVSDSERSQIISECVAGNSASFNSSNGSLTSKENRSVEKRGKLVSRSGVITSTLTRAAAAQGRTTVANMGALRLVIKAPNSQVTKEKQKTGKPRVSLSGEVWVHLECVLWAPGTYIIGDGTIGGLGEALQLSLDTICSHCDKRGAILNCCSRGCNLSYHYRCALLAECQLDYEQYTLLCKKHHIYT